MPHVFVETNWLFAYAAPAHHQDPDAVTLLDRARSGAFTLHIPNPCIGEARQAIRSKCQPRTEGKAIRDFLGWAERIGDVTLQDAATGRVIVDKFESYLKKQLSKLDDVIKELGSLPCVNFFGLDDAMLDRATALALDGIAPKPFDHAIFAAVLVRAERLWQAGERGICFCERDADLQPWDREAKPKAWLRAIYDAAHIWVYRDFALTYPPRPADFE